MNELTFISPSKLILTARTIRILLFIILSIWCLGFSYASIFPHSDAIVIYPVLKQFYSVVCHQTGHKSFNLNGFTFLVCARCTGIYLGALAGSFFLIMLKKTLESKPKYFLFALIPMILDIIFYSVGIYNYNKSVAFITGAISGSVTILYISDSLENILAKKTETC